MSWLLVALLAVASFYLFYLDLRSGLVVGQDIQYELVCLIEFKEALATQIYPRLAPDLHFGYGSPIFIFYPPLFMLLTSLVDFVFDNLNYSAKFVIAGLGVMGSLFCYAFLRLFASRGAALLGTVFFIFAPYKFIEIYRRSAFAEYTAMSLVPAVFYYLASAFIRKKTTSTGPQLGLFIGSALLLLSHPLSFLLAFPFLIAAALCFYWKAGSDSSSALFRVVATVAMAVGATSFYLVPAFFYRDLVRMEELLTGKFHFGQNFIDLRELFFDAASFYYQSPLPAVILVGAAVVLLARGFRFEESPLGWLGLGSALMTFFMMTPFSAVLWAKLPMIAYVQFPARFLLLSGFFVCWLVAFLADQIRRRRMWMPGAVVGSVVALLWIHQGQYPAVNTLDASQMWPERILEWNLPAATDRDEYLPKAMHNRIAKGTSERWKAVFGGSSNYATARPIHYKRCDAFPEAMRTRFALTNFPFWQVSVDGVVVSYSPDAPALEFDVPAGAHCVEAKLVYPVAMIAGFVLSGCSLAAFLLVLRLGERLVGVCARQTKLRDGQSREQGLRH
ncbi:MAG TPA: 6-pyruvoyl-tetrahydropterin synthase-related protein [Candidatus Acidoferrales bacterium]|nr:6-pyruvoyl-tetrahydropterin synthase-related protein [Candidatus Acidoferrales bacterium]